MGQLGQTITVINKSGVVVKNSKHLINAFKEAKNAYREKKAELKAHRQADWDEKQTRHKLKHLDLEDNVSRSSSRRRHHHDPAATLHDPPHHTHTDTTEMTIATMPGRQWSAATRTPSTRTGMRA